MKYFSGVALFSGSLAMGTLCCFFGQKHIRLILAVCLTVGFSGAAWVSFSGSWTQPIALIDAGFALAAAAYANRWFALFLAGTAGSWQIMELFFKADIHLDFSSPHQMMWIGVCLLAGIVTMLEGDLLPAIFTGFLGARILAGLAVFAAANLQSLDQALTDRSLSDLVMLHHQIQQTAAEYFWPTFLLSALLTAAGVFRQFQAQTAYIE